MECSRCGEEQDLETTQEAQVEGPRADVWVCLACQDDAAGDRACGVCRGPRLGSMGCGGCEGDAPHCEKCFAKAPQAELDDQRDLCAICYGDWASGQEEDCSGPTYAESASYDSQRFLAMKEGR